jgi:hypothetical protein
MAEELGGIGLPPAPVPETVESRGEIPKSTVECGPGWRGG